MLTRIYNQALPFVIAPLVIFTSSQAIMSVPTTLLPDDEAKEEEAPTEEESTKRSASEWRRVLNPLRRREGREGYESYANGVGVIYLCGGACFPLFSCGGRKADGVWWQ